MELTGRNGFKTHYLLIAFSFDTKTGDDSVNALLARQVLAAIKTSTVEKIIPQEEVYRALLIICSEPDWKEKELIIVEYNNREYLNSYDVASEALDLAGKHSHSHEILIVSHNHMFPRVKAVLENLGRKVSAYRTAIDYDEQADQPWVRSNTAFALHEAAAYLFFVLKGYI